MNKRISTNERVFMCISGSSGTGKTHLILSMLTEPMGDGCLGIFHPQFDKIIYFFRFWQPIYNDFKSRLKNSIVFSRCPPAAARESGGENGSLSNGEYDVGEGGGDDGTITSDHNTFNQILDNLFADSAAAASKQHTVLVFDDSCEEILQSRSFATLATAGRHKNLHAIFIKHNLYQQGKFSVTVDKNTTHVIITKSPRIGKQLKILGSELQCADGVFLHECYRECMLNSEFGHFLIDLTPSCPDYLRFCTNITKTYPDVRTPIDRYPQTSFNEQTVFFVPPVLLKQLKFSSLRHSVVNDSIRGLPLDLNTKYSILYNNENSGSRFFPQNTIKQPNTAVDTMRTDQQKAISIQSHSFVLLPLKTFKSMFPPQQQELSTEFDSSLSSSSSSKFKQNNEVEVGVKKIPFTGDTIPVTTTSDAAVTDSPLIPQAHVAELLPREGNGDEFKKSLSPTTSQKNGKFKKKQRMLILLSLIDSNPQISFNTSTRRLQLGNATQTLSGRSTIVHIVDFLKHLQQHNKKLPITFFPFINALLENEQQPHNFHETNNVSSSEKHELHPLEKLITNKQCLEYIQSRKASKLLRSDDS